MRNLVESSAFMTAEEVGEDMCPVLIGYDHDSRGIWAIAVEAKGAVKSPVQFVKDKIDNALRDGEIGRVCSCG